MSTALIKQLLSKIEALEATVSALTEEVKLLQNSQSTNTKTAHNAALSVDHSPNTKATKGRVLRLPDVLKIVGFKRSTLYAKIKEGRFPSQIKLSERCSGWFESDIFNFLNSLAGGVVCA